MHTETYRTPDEYRESVTDIADEDREAATIMIGEAIAEKLTSIYAKRRACKLSKTDRIEYVVYTHAWYYLSENGYKIPYFEPEAISKSERPTDYEVLKNCFFRRQDLINKMKSSSGSLNKRQAIELCVIESFLNSIDDKEEAARSLIDRYNEEH